MSASQPVSYVKAHLAEVINQVQDSHDPVTITQNGVPSAVLVDHESWENTRKALGMLKLISMGEHDIRAGRTIPQEEVFDKLRARINSRAADGDNEGYQA